eukprot:scaffold52186_cov29-Tisochrysis_lutea.AAC.4
MEGVRESGIRLKDPADGTNGAARDAIDVAILPEALSSIGIEGSTRVEGTGRRRCRHVVTTSASREIRAARCAACVVRVVDDGRGGHAPPPAQVGCAAVPIDRQVQAPMHVCNVAFDATARSAREWSEDGASSFGSEGKGIRHVLSVSASPIAR